MIPAPDPTRPNGFLPRLRAEAYRAQAIVHWTITTQHRTALPLDPCFHLRVRELLLHSQVRENLFCPAYVLMPDHLHLLWMGTGPDSDQRRGMAFFRTHLGRALAPAKIRLQHQAHDHVLDAAERERNAFVSTCGYILMNPVRAGLVEGRLDWMYRGAVVPGYPHMEPLSDAFWERFWAIYNRVVDGGPLVDRTVPAS